jgi:hypothetical protein
MGVSDLDLVETKGLERGDPLLNDERGLFTRDGHTILLLPSSVQRMTVITLMIVIRCVALKEGVFHQRHTRGKPCGAGRASTQDVPAGLTEVWRMLCPRGAHP